MAWYPGATPKPISIPGRPLRVKGRGYIPHIAVSEAHSLVPWNQNDWHFYVAKDGYCEQYIDTDYVAYCQIAGNATLVSAESQGGVTNPDGEPFTAAQLERHADIAAWLSDPTIDGMPLQLMHDSLPASKGIGYHRLGIDPYRIAGGEIWSDSYGKTCPGTAKIAQIPAMLARAIEIRNGDPLADPEVIALLKAIDNRLVHIRTSVEHTERIVGDAAVRDQAFQAALSASVKALTDGLPYK